MVSKNQEFWRLRKMIQNFEKLDAELLEKFKQAIKEKYKWDEFCNFFEQVRHAKREIKRFLSEKSDIKVAPGGLTQTLKKIKYNYGYNIDTLCNFFSNELGITISQESEEDMDFDDLLDKLWGQGIVSYVDQGYFWRKNEVATIIVSQSLPPTVLKRLDKIKECYALGLFEATVIFCRAVIEAGFFEYLKKRKPIPNKKVICMEEYSSKELRERIKQLKVLDDSLYKDEEETRHLANDVLHSKKSEKIEVSEQKALFAVKTTFAIIEKLFA